MSHSSGTDDSGRPIVAELGRPETPEEIADRRAAATARRRANQTPLNLVLALAASLAVVALVVLVVVRPASVERDPVDYQSVASDAQQVTAVPLVVPDLPDGWSANRAELTSGGSDGVSTWQIGFITPGEQYIGFVQGVEPDARWLSSNTAGAEPTGRVTISDREWDVYDRRAVRDPGNLAYILVTVAADTTIVLGGTAADDEFEVLAHAVAKELSR